MKLMISSLVFSLIFLFGCKKSTDSIAQQFEEVVPYGTWIYSGFEDSISTYYSAVEFEEYKPGIAFKIDNVYIERSSGRCQTPPLTFSNYEGKWEVINDNTLKITCSNWLDENYVTFMEIINRSKSELKVIFRTIPE